MKTVYDFSLKDKNGNEVSLNEYKDKVLLIVKWEWAALKLVLLSIAQI